MARLFLLDTEHHEVIPDPSTVRDSQGHPWASLNPAAMPATALCQLCGIPIVIRTWFTGDWQHDYFRKIPAQSARDDSHRGTVNQAGATTTDNEGNSSENDD